MPAKLVVGNWKMNGSLRGNASLLDALATRWSGVRGRELAVCVPFPYLPQARERLRGSDVRWGAQDVSEHAAGAFTGEVSAAMLRDCECRYALVGHSERRATHGETDAIVAAKAVAALGGGLTPIVCLGETLEQRDSGETERVVERQFSAVAAALGQSIARVVIAYEPVWAIGTGRTATPEQAQEVHAFLRAKLRRAQAESVPLLYGGSVKAGNAGSLFAMPDVDGGLVGGASLDADEFLAIAHA